MWSINHFPERSTLKTTFAPALVIAAALALTGCTADTPVAKQPEQTQSQPADQSEKKSATLQFGQTYTYDAGITMTVNAPEEFTPGPNADGADQEHNLKFVFTIVNGSDENLQPVVFTHVSSAGTEASSVYDDDAGAGSDPQTVILPGGAVTWTQAFSVADPSSLVMQTSPNMNEYVDLVFTNTK